MASTDSRDEAPEGDVLSALPRTRPQRRSARRATPPKAAVAAASDALARPAVAAGKSRSAPEPRAARRRPAAKAGPTAASDKGPAKTRPAGAAKPRAAAAKPRSGAAAKPRATGTAKPGAKARPRRAPEPAAPERAATPEVPAAGYATGPGSSRNGGERPGTGELVTTALQAVGELAQLGAAVGGQAVRSALRRIPRP